MRASTHTVHCHARKKLDHIMIVFLGLEMFRALWQMWGSFDNGWPTTIQQQLLPTVYVNCILSALLVSTSISTTYFLYKEHLRYLMVNWWIFYTLTVCSFLNSCGNLALHCVMKDRFFQACTSEEHAAMKWDCEDCDKPALCVRQWEETLIWNSLTLILDLAINMGFAYAVFRCRTNHTRFTMTNSASTSQVQPIGGHGANSRPKIQVDEDGFQIIELK
ncbi:uncharacterized protein BYT42DRAFT_544194 [Radiomyces spectabilis]|uniref:uncharacterized protein n=1 Tax=Radiomyces spectabilis TaxID=64574 RepID=UPI00221FE75E|nr:uncharacterized protein BYT42DRAFT_544194 [Radiomyces spectabilis]KAI8384267.1 hypothetical protein BYT42DRAFT_544194 [Radiomyces spectabilis]